MEDRSFETLAQEHFSALLSFCLAKTCDQYKAEELAQETMMRAYLSFGKLKKRDAFHAWLIGIAKRCYWLNLRFKKRDPLEKRSNPWGTEPPLDLADRTETADVRLMSEERIASTLNALKKLPHRQREVIILKYFENLSYAEMAIRLQISVEAVDKRLTRAKSTLKRHLTMGDL